MKTVEVNTSDLIGAALDWAVAKADGGERKPYQFASNEGAPFWDAWVFPDGRAYSSFTPSCEWSHCGPLIEKYRAYPDRYHDTVVISEEGRFFVLADSETLNFGDEFESMEGSTPLIAACRAIVAAKLGDTVSVPAELATRGPK